jgi:hypothetical protein
MQVFRHPIESSYNKEERAHYIRGFLISTKPTQRTRTDPVNGFSISKATAHEKVKTFLGKSFAIIPESLSDVDPKGDGHFYAHGRDALVQGYDRHAHGKIKGLYGPFFYNDGSGDYWYDFNIKLFNSQSAAALIEHGERMWIPFAVSPHIVRQEESPHDSKDWEGVGVALVRRGAYGDGAVISKLCEGTDSQCSHSMAGAYYQSAGMVEGQPAEPLTKDQLSDLHAAMRVNTENIMEIEISNFIHRGPPLENPLERIESETPDYVTRSQQSQQYALRSIQGAEAKPYLSDVLVNAQAGGPSHREFNEQTGAETIVRDPPLVDQYKAIVNRDLDQQFNAINLDDPNAWEQQGELRTAMDQRESQVDSEYASVINEIQGDINSEKMDLNNEGQLVSERFGWQSASEAMAQGQYGQTNGGIRGVTDSTVNVGAGGGGGECCIFNQYGGGGCGPCR